LNKEFRKRLSTLISKKEDQKDDSEKIQNEKDAINFIKSKYIPDSKPIFITIKDHKIEGFINDLEKVML
jgi:hypothetical protein